MQEPEFPADESHRIEVLHSLHVLDTPPEERFDRITRVAQRLFDVPIALVSLVDSDRQWFKSCQGLSASETPRSISFCGHAILSPDTFVVANTLADPRFVDNPLVTGPPNIRFYAGHPLQAADGSLLGTLCIIDDKPRNFTPDMLALLADLAGCVERELNQLTLIEAKANIEASHLQLHQSRQQLQHVLACSPSVTYTLNLDCGNSRLTWVSENIKRFFGFDADEILAEPDWWEKHVHDEDRDSAVNAIFALLDKGHTVRSYRMRNHAGQYIWVRDELQMLENDDDIRQAVGTWNDITEYKKVERLKKEFVSTVSHELRTPLTSIRGSLGLVAGGVAGELPQQAKSLVDIAFKNSERLLGLINDLLDVEKIESGKMKFDLKSSRLMEIVDQCLDNNQGVAQQYRVSFEMKERISENLQVMVDEMRLMQVLSNLLSNAAKFSPKDGVVEIGVTQNGKRLRVSVKDYGSGIPHAFRSSIFQKFSQADSSDTRQKGGTGLGLSIAKAIIEHLHGTIGFDTIEGEGATFWVELPQWDSEPES